MAVMFKIVQGDIPSLPSKFDNELQTIYSRYIYLPFMPDFNS